MKKTVAYIAEGSSQLHGTARSAREAEFDKLYVAIHAAMGSVKTESGYVGLAQSIAENLRGTIYPTAADAFLEAADYLREHRAVLTGAALDPEER